MATVVGAKPLVAATARTRPSCFGCVCVCECWRWSVIGSLIKYRKVIDLCMPQPTQLRNETRLL